MSRFSAVLLQLFVYALELLKSKPCYFAQVDEKPFSRRDHVNADVVKVLKIV